MKVFSATARLQEHPGDQPGIGRRDSELLHGEYFRAVDLKDGWYYGRSVLDGYTGWVRGSALEDVRRENRPTHAVTALSANIYQEPDSKTMPVANLSFMSRLCIDATRSEKGFVAVKDRIDQWIPEHHIVAIDTLNANPADIVETAMLFNGCPYLYSGRTAQGIDCSAVVQLAAQRNNIFCPRDSDQQLKHLKQKVSMFAPRQRGDIVFFPGHVGIMIDGENILNATMRRMEVVVEPLAEMKKHYIESGRRAITGVRRLTP